MARKQILIYSGGGSQCRGQHAEIKQTVNGQRTLRSRSVHGRRARVPRPAPCHQQHLSRTQLGQEVRESSGQKKKLSNSQDLANKRRKDQGVTGPGSRAPPVLPAQLANNYMGITTCECLLADIVLPFVCYSKQHS